MAHKTSLSDPTGIKTLFKKASQNRFKSFGKYRLDRWMFQAGMFLIFAWLLFVANWYHFDLNYYKCDGGTDPFNPGMCKNPFYKPVSWVNLEYLSPGEYGTILGPMFHSVYYAPFLIFGLILGLNHIIHNKRRRST